MIKNYNEVTEQLEKTVTLKILLFGIAGQIIKEAKVDMNVDLPITVNDLKDLLMKKYPQLKEISTFFIAVNETYAGDEAVIADAASTIALIPPVSGG